MTAGISDRPLGAKVLEIRVEEPFRPAVGWQVRERPRLVTVRSNGIEPRAVEKLDLYHWTKADTDALTPVAIDGRELADWIQRIRGCPLRVLQGPEPVAVADGWRYELILYGGIQATLRLSWIRGHAPEECADVATVVNMAAHRFNEIGGGTASIKGAAG